MLLASQGNGGYIEMPDVSKVETARRTGKGGTKQVSSGDGGVFETIIWEDGWYQWNGSANPHAGIQAKDPNGNVMTILGEVQIYLKKCTWIRYQDSDIYHFTDTIKYTVQYN